MKKTIFNLTGFLCLFTFFFCALALARPDRDVNELMNCACQNESALACLEELKDKYFKENKYSEFVELLKNICPANKAVGPSLDYYIALSRYNQLKYLEEAKAWDEYFAKGNDYRDDIINRVQKAISTTNPKEQTHIQARLLLYQFHKDQRDDFVEPSLKGLLDSVSEYAQADNNIEVIKQAAEKLSAYDEKTASRQLYKIYAQKLSASGIEDQALKNIAVNFYKEANAELSQYVYDIYIERIAKTFTKEKFIQELEGIARAFAYKDSGVHDMLYAEKIFKRIEQSAGKEDFNEELMYLRGFNLEKSKAYAQARDIYADFLKKYPHSRHAAQVIYKTAVISTYILRDPKTGRVYFEQLSQTTPVSTYSLAGLYQLGLLKQWEGDFTQAKGYYKKLLDKVAGIDPDRLALVQGRMLEIDKGKPIEYNLKLGLDTALKEEFVYLDMSKVELKSNLYQPEKGKEISISTNALLGPSGCLQVELQYLWSGDTAGLALSASQPGFKASFKSPGTQVIILVLVSPSGIAERSVELIDVH